MKTMNKIILGATSLGLLASGAVFAANTDLAIQINDGVLSVDIVDQNGDPVPNPGVTMSAIAYSFKDQTTTGTLGSETEKIRLSNPTSTATWSVSIAATDGEDAVWTDGTHSMDYNDPNGGRLTIDPSTGTIAEANGGETTGVSLGSSATFEAGSVGSITLYSADSNASAFAQYDLTGVGLSQVIPAKQQPAAYTLGLTLTAL